MTGADAERRFESTKKQIAIQKLLSALRTAEDGSSCKFPIELLTLDQNIRSSIDKDGAEFLQLKESIRNSGLLQLPVVAVTDSSIRCIGGHRRIEALKDLGEQQVKCTIRKISEPDALILAQLIENTARENLHIVDMARAIDKIKRHQEGKLVALAQQHGKGKTKFSASKIAKLIGKERKYVEQLLKVAKWEDKAQVFALTLKLTYRQIIELNANCNTETEVYNALLALGNNDPKPVPKRQGANAGMRIKNRAKLDKFLEDHKVDRNTRKVLLQFLSEMKIKGWQPEP